MGGSFFKDLPKVPRDQGPKADALKLKQLDLSKLRLTQLAPSAIHGRESVKVLNVSSNRLTALPSWISEMTALEVLDASENQLLSIPPELAMLPKLRLLLLRNNHLRGLPLELDSLKLEKLDLVGNDELEIPNSLLEEGSPSEIMRYYAACADGGQPLQELKVIFVGRGTAGKTSLLKTLSGKHPDLHEPETHSICVTELLLPSQRGQVKARCWDFGGQEILHSTHQFFLTERTLYVLVLEPRSGLAQRDAEYWLELIRTQGGASPVVIALNKSFRRPWSVDSIRLKRKYEFISQIVNTDAFTEYGIEELRRALVETVESKLPDVWIPFPGRWWMIKKSIAGMRQNFLSYREFCDLCTKYKVEDSAAQSDLAVILHRLGLVLHFGRDPRLHDTRVLNPTWVTGGVYAVVRSSLVKERNGQLTVSDMSQILREAEEAGTVQVKDYPNETHAFILQLMSAFQVAYAGDEEKNAGRFLVPELLPEFEPQMPEDWDSSPIRLRYHYDVLPPGLLPRFIVRTHGLSESAPHWRYGVVLRHAGSSALIRGEVDHRELQVFVRDGEDETRRVLVGMVREELAILNAQMKIQPIEELELSGSQERWISVESLTEIERHDGGTVQRLPIQPQGTSEVNVSAELDKLLPKKARTPQVKSAEDCVRIFVSYAHEDERALKRLDMMLGVLEQYHDLAAWRDRRLIAGEHWDAEIRRRLEDAEIFLFIGSAAAMTRPYIRDPELRRAKERHGDGNLEVVTVKLEPCACDEDPFLSGLQRLAPRYRSIAEARIKSSAWEEVRRDLLPVIEKVKQRKWQKRSDN
jgi:internalin A